MRSNPPLPTAYREAPPAFTRRAGRVHGSYVRRHVDDGPGATLEHPRDNHLQDYERGDDVAFEGAFEDVDRSGRQAGVVAVAPVVGHVDDHVYASPRVEHRRDGRLDRRPVRHVHPDRKGSGSEGFDLLPGDLETAGYGGIRPATLKVPFQNAGALLDCPGRQRHIVAVLGQGDGARRSDSAAGAGYESDRPARRHVELLGRRGRTGWAGWSSVQSITTWRSAISQLPSTVRS